MARRTRVAAQRENRDLRRSSSRSLVSSGREATDERQYCQREQLFMRHCEFHSVPQAILEQHLEPCRRMQR
jgi:hypothetical protein